MEVGRSELGVFLWSRSPISVFCFLLSAFFTAARARKSGFRQSGLVERSLSLGPGPGRDPPWPRAGNIRSRPNLRRGRCHPAELPRLLQRRVDEPWPCRGWGCRQRARPGWFAPGPPILEPHSLPNDRSKRDVCLGQHLFNPGKFVVCRVATVEGEGLHGGVSTLNAMDQPQQ